jgi:S1-C subfamily serine protease
MLFYKENSVMMKRPAGRQIVKAPSSKQQLRSNYFILRVVILLLTALGVLSSSVVINQRLNTSNQLKERAKISPQGVVHIECPRWQGSGFFLDEKTIITARHCVEKVESFWITTHDGHRLHATRAISIKKYDIGLVRLDSLECHNTEVDHMIRFGGKHTAEVHPPRLGSITECELGDPVFVIGSPFGKINFNNLTAGVISNLNADWSPLGEDYGWEIAFTTDAAGHPGNSGCPVFSLDGVARGILVGGFSPSLISVMPCDLFMGDLAAIEMMFVQDKYQFEVGSPYENEYYEYNGYYEPDDYGWNYKWTD